MRDDPVTPGFNFADFGVLDGTFSYQFNAQTDHWDLLQFADVLVPVAIPEPATLGLLGAAFVLLVFARNRGSAAS
ncbi:MAG: PEP-CTERM sorting domain-containing protein [Pirellulales bacterium]|nr:PEP-CTERM sorting domain-containing protein [Pirellulales bacterium]